MRTIWKYPLCRRSIELEMPTGAELLTVQMLDGDPVLWALVDPENPTEKRMFRAFEIGEGMPNDPGKYIGTFQSALSILVWHVFDVTHTKT